MGDTLSKEHEQFLDQVGKWQSWSDGALSTFRNQWAKNIKLARGIEDTVPQYSKTRKRSKLFVRKVWATNWRLLASLYAAFLKDRDHFKIEGRDLFDDPGKARTLQYMVEYRRDRMMRAQSLFTKLVWGMQDIIECGLATGKLSWHYDENTGRDEPQFTLYPPEQVYLDLMAETKEDMRFVIFEDYLFKSDLEEMGYDNIDDCEPESVPTNIVRNTRWMSKGDPRQNPGENEYPELGKYGDTDKRMLHANDIYRVWTVFYKDDGIIKMGVTCKDKTILKEPGVSPYGDRYPLVLGSCLLVPHVLIGEGFPEPLEGPQKSYNAHINQRKDNVALALNRQTIVSRFGGVDLQSLLNSRPGGITMADDVNAVKEREIQDVTQSAYMEAAADEHLMNEMSGITPVKQGRETAEKATVAQINYTESNAKIDLFIAIVGETFIRDFYSTLTYLIQRFETDEKVFRIANAKMVRDEDLQMVGRLPAPVWSIDIEADVIVDVGAGTVGRELEIRQLMLAFDRAVMANQAMANMMQFGITPPNGLRLIDTSAFMEDLLPKLGRKDTKRYFINIQPPQQGPPQGGQQPGQGNQGMRGRMTPKPGQAAGGVMTGGEAV